jgi:hypothetical protein
MDDDGLVRRMTRQVLVAAGFGVLECALARFRAFDPAILFGAIDVSYVVVPEGDARTRLLVKLRVQLPGAGIVARLRRSVLAWGIW